MLRNPPLALPFDGPTGYTGQSTISRDLASGNAVLTTGRLYLTSIYLRAGEQVTALAYISAATAVVGGTHGWVSLHDSSRVLLRQSADDASIAWAAQTLKEFVLTAPWVATYTGVHYAGLMVEAATPPTVAYPLQNANNSGAVQAAPSRGGVTTNTYTTTAPATATAISSNSTFAPYVLWR